MPNEDQVFIQRSVRWFITLGIAIALVVGLGWLLQAALTPLAVAFGIAYLLSPLIDRFEAHRVPRSVAILLLLLAVLGLLAGAALFLVPRIHYETAMLAQKLPGYVDALVSELGPTLEQRFGVKLPGTVAEGLERLRSLDWAPLLAGARKLGSQMLGAFTGTLQAAVSVVLVPVLAFYMLAGFPAIKSGIRSLVPRPYLDFVTEKVRTADRLLSGFVRGQLLVAIIDGILYAIGFAVIGVPAAIVIGLVAGLLAIIPYVGGAVAIGSASLMCVLEYGFGVELVAVIGWYAVVQMLEGFVLTPRIVGESLGLHPVTVIVALLIGGDLLGFLGLLVAVPLAAIVQVILQDVLQGYRGSELYSGRPAAGVDPPGRDG